VLREGLFRGSKHHLLNFGYKTQNENLLQTVDMLSKPHEQIPTDICTGNLRKQFQQAQ
jgi:hypothetical protein